MNVLLYLLLLLILPAGVYAYHRRSEPATPWLVMLCGLVGWWVGGFIVWMVSVPFLWLFATGPAVLYGVYTPLWGAVLPLAVGMLSDRTEEGLSVGGGAMLGAFAGAMLGVAVALVGGLDAFPRSTLEQVTFVALGFAGGTGATILGTLCAANNDVR